jgi:hypothetical protein
VESVMNLGFTLEAILQEKAAESDTDELSSSSGLTSPADGLS